MRRSAALTLVVAGTVLIIGYFAWRPREVDAPVSRSAVSLPTPVDRDEPRAALHDLPARASAETVTVAATTTPPAALDERSIMGKLRELGDSSPAYSLELARGGNQRFPGSADAPEREWYVCKSLVNLENFYDAREEARFMVATYPGTPWTTDVERHLLVNPLELPGDPPP